MIQRRRCHRKVPRSGMHRRDSREEKSDGKEGWALRRMGRIAEQTRAAYREGDDPDLVEIAVNPNHAIVAFRWTLLILSLAACWKQAPEGNPLPPATTRAATPAAETLPVVDPRAAFEAADANHEMPETSMRRLAPISSRPTRMVMVVSPLRSGRLYQPQNLRQAIEPGDCHVHSSSLYDRTHRLGLVESDAGAGKNQQQVA